MTTIVPQTFECRIENKRLGQFVSSYLTDRNGEPIDIGDRKESDVMVTIIDTDHEVVLLELTEMDQLARQWIKYRRPVTWTT